MSIDDIHRRAWLTDIHAHPSLKTYFFDKYDLKHHHKGLFYLGRHKTPKGLDPFATRTDLEMMKLGGVRSMWMAHYVPEPSIFDDAGPFLRLLLGIFTPRVTKKEFDRPLFDKLIEMMDIVEGHIEANSNEAVLAKTHTEYLDLLSTTDKMVFVHTVEGAHTLTEARNDSGHVDEDEIVRRMERLADRGVALLTLCHFYKNGVASHVNAIPDCGGLADQVDWHLCACQPPHLTDQGKVILNKAEELGMLIDLTHSTVDARGEIFDFTDPNRPIVASHVGVQEMWAGYTCDDSRHQYNLSDEEINLIKDRGGAIGIIFSPWWLHHECEGDGIDFIWETMDHIHSVTDSWEHVMIGTDFDGLTNVPDDLRDYSEIGRLTSRLIRQGLTDGEIINVLGANARRVLKKTWGSKV